MIIKEIAKKASRSIPYKWRTPLVYKRFLNIHSEVPEGMGIAEWQKEKFKEMALYAYRTVPGYKQLYTEAGIKEKDLIHLENIDIVPFTTKELIRDNVDDFLSRAVKTQDIKLSMTSGSSGHPLQFYQLKAEDWIENAFVANAWAEGGWNIDQSGLQLRGGYTGNEQEITKRSNNNVFYVHNKSILCSPNYLIHKYYGEYKRALQSRDIKYIFAFPSSITNLCELIISEGDEGLFDIEAIYLSSENLYDWQLTLIERVFPKAKIIDLYGQSERVIMASWRSNSRLYYANPYYGLTELLGIDEKEVKAGATGELVGTSFWAKATPFIRYRMKDYACKSDVEDKGMVLSRIDGRLQEVIVGRNGRHVSMTAIANIHDSSYDGITKFRFFQEEPGKVKFMIVCEGGFSEERKADVRKSLLDKMGDDFDVEVQVVDELKPSKSGKYSYLDQRIKIQNTDRLQY